MNGVAPGAAPGMTMPVSGSPAFPAQAVGGGVFASGVQADPAAVQPQVDPAYLQASAMPAPGAAAPGFAAPPMAPAQGQPGVPQQQVFAGVPGGFQVPDANGLLGAVPQAVSGWQPVGVQQQAQQPLQFAALQAQVVQPPAAVAWPQFAG